MKKEYDIEDEINRTMNSLDDLDHADPGPYFYTRLKARMDRENEGETIQTWVYSWKFGLAVILLLLNVGILFWHRDQKMNDQTNRETFLNYVSRDFSLGQNTGYQEFYNF